MERIASLADLRQMPSGTVRGAMETRVSLCREADDGLIDEMEEDFGDCLGGYWYVFEEGDDPRSFPMEGGVRVDLLGEDWDWCDDAILEDGCFSVFWGTNDAGGPCLFVPDAQWIPEELRKRLHELIAEAMF